MSYDDDDEPRYEDMTPEQIRATIPDGMAFRSAASTLAAAVSSVKATALWLKAVDESGSPDEITNATQDAIAELADLAGQLEILRRWTQARSGTS